MKIKCEFKYRGWSDDCKINLYTCFVASAAITERDTQLTCFDGVHLSGKDNSDVQAIYFSNVIVHYFPRGLNELFPQLIALQITDCGLKTISRADLIGLEALEILTIDKNKLRSIPSNLLTGMCELTRISFGCNKIEFLSSKLFRPIMSNKLTLINLDRNASIDSSYWPLRDNHVASVDELMKIIDDNCKKPIEDQSIKAFESDLKLGIRALWNSTALRDFTIIADNKKFEVHKYILAIHSRVLADKFKNESKGNESTEMNIGKFSSSAVEVLLRYIYTGEILGNAKASELLAISEKLEVNTLFLLCEEMILKELEESNASPIAYLQYFNSNRIRKWAFSEIRNLYPDINLRDDDLMKQPEQLIEMIELKQKYEAIKRRFQEEEIED